MDKNGLYELAVKLHYYISPGKSVTQLYSNLLSLNESGEPGKETIESLRGKADAAISELTLKRAKDSDDYSPMLNMEETDKKLFMLACDIKKYKLQSHSVADIFYMLVKMEGAGNQDGIESLRAQLPAESRSKKEG